MTSATAGGWWRRAMRDAGATLAACMLLAALSGDRAAGAASLALDAAETQAALRFGAQSVELEAFDAEWHAANGAGEQVLVVTPFHRVAALARHATFQNEPVKTADVDRALKEQRDRLLFWTDVKGRREDFARRLRPELRVGDRTIMPAFVQNERTANPQGGGTYVARCLYAFPSKDLTGRERLSLVIRDADGREAHTFKIDLSRMR